jgi:O-6-methylguanine DNA methyltransferase
MRHHLFDTALGRLGVAWDEAGLARVALPESSDEALRARLGGTAGRPPPPVRETVAKIRAHVSGDLQRFDVADLVRARVEGFDRRVYEVVSAIPAGHVRRYGEVAEALGSKGLSRAVGQALGRNPLPIVMPCHRVLAQGAMGGFTARDGVELKRALLAIEGALPLPSLFAADGSLAIDAGAVLRQLSEADPKLGELIAKVGPFRMTRSSAADTYESLARAIVGQQISGLAARAIFARFEGAFGGRLPRPEALREASDESLRAVGLSRPKQLALRDLAEKVLDGTVLPLRKLEPVGDRAIVERLIEVRGIGQWTVEMMLMFRLGRPDVLPVDDYGVRKGFGRTFLNGRLPTPKDVARRGERWRPWRTVASWYLWRALELP